jgi:hypothetical protein
MVQYGAGAQHGPVESGFGAQHVQRLARTFGRAEVLGGEVRRVEQLQSRRHFQRTAAAHHEQPFHDGIVRRLKDRAEALHVVAAHVVRALAAQRHEHGVEASQLRGQARAVIHVALLRCQSRVGRETLGSTHQAADAMAARQRFGQQSGADEAAGADDGDVHVESPGWCVSGGAPRRR